LQYAQAITPEQEDTSSEIAMLEKDKTNAMKEKAARQEARETEQKAMTQAVLSEKRGEPTQMAKAPEYVLDTSGMPTQMAKAPSRSFNQNIINSSNINNSTSLKDIPEQVDNYYLALAASGFMA
jgi:hypothetical protein